MECISCQKVLPFYGPRIIETLGIPEALSTPGAPGVLKESDALEAAETPEVTETQTATGEHQGYQMYQTQQKH